MSRSKKDAVGGHRDRDVSHYGYGQCNHWGGSIGWSPEFKRFTKRHTRRRLRDFNRIRIADMLQMHEEYEEDRHFECYGEPEWYDDEPMEDYMWDSWDDHYSRACSECGRVDCICHEYDDDPYDYVYDYDYYYSDYDTGYSHYSEATPRYQVIDNDHGTVVAEGKSLADILSSIQSYD